MNVLSLFDGISCGQIALSRSGFKVDNYFASEIEKRSILITQKNFPNTIQLGDVCKIDSSKLPKIDIVIGGSPCQSFSSANAHSRNGLDGKSKLFWEFVRLVNEIKPEFFLLENVVMKKQWLEIITKALGVNPVFIDSADFSAQTRKRMYWTNIRIPEWGKKRILFPEILDKWDGPWLSLNENQFRKLSKLNPSIEKSNALTQAQSRKGSSSEYLTMLAKIKKAQNAEGYRPITPNECERLQTIPVDYTKADGVPDLKRMNAIGNGWTVDVVSHIFKGMNKNSSIHSECLFNI